MKVKICPNFAYKVNIYRNLAFLSTILVQILVIRSKSVLFQLIGLFKIKICQFLGKKKEIFVHLDMYIAMYSLELASTLECAFLSFRNDSKSKYSINQWRSTRLSGTWFYMWTVSNQCEGIPQSPITNQRFILRYVDWWIAPIRWPSIDLGRFDGRIRLESSQFMTCPNKSIKSTAKILIISFSAHN